MTLIGKNSKSFLNFLLVYNDTLCSKRFDVLIYPISRYTDLFGKPCSIIDTRIIKYCQEDSNTHLGGAAFFYIVHTIDFESTSSLYSL